MVLTSTCHSESSTGFLFLAKTAHPATDEGKEKAKKETQETKPTNQQKKAESVAKSGKTPTGSGSKFHFVMDLGLEPLHGVRCRFLEFVGLSGVGSRPTVLDFGA